MIPGGPLYGFYIGMAYMGGRLPNFEFCYARFLEMCYNPIGRDDTGRVAVCVLYRDGLYRRKIGEKGVDKYAQTQGK